MTITNLGVVEIKAQHHNVPQTQSFWWFALIESAAQQEIPSFLLLIRFNLAGLLESLIIFGSISGCGPRLYWQKYNGHLTVGHPLNFAAVYFFTFQSFLFFSNKFVFFFKFVFKSLDFGCKLRVKR